MKTMTVEGKTAQTLGAFRNPERAARFACRTKAGMVVTGDFDTDAFVYGVTPMAHAMRLERAGYEVASFADHLAPHLGLISVQRH